MFTLFALLAPLALADTLTLDNGALVAGELLAYDPAGECRIALSGGELDGATLLLPCARLAAFERTPRDFEPISAAPLQEEELVDEPVIAPEPPVEPGEPAPPSAPLAVAEPALAPAPEEVAEPAYEPPPALPPVSAPSSGRVPSPPRAPSVREPARALSW